MIEKTFLEQHATKIQTSLRNILREYFQHLFLFNFYQAKGSEHFYFKGGTALKLVFNSPRFSEDLDFSATKNSFVYEDTLQEILIKIQREGIDCNLEESKKTTGGHLAIIELAIYDERFEIKTEVSYRKRSLEGEKPIVISDIFPSYTVNILCSKNLIQEKQNALLERYKPRDLFDLYFILRSDRLRRFLRIDDLFLNKTKKLLEKVKLRQVETEIKEFLPHPFWPVVKDLKKNLLSELREL